MSGKKQMLVVPGAIKTIPKIRLAGFGDKITPIKKTIAKTPPKTGKKTPPLKASCGLSTFALYEPMIDIMPVIAKIKYKTASPEQYIRYQK